MFVQEMQDATQFVYISRKKVLLPLEKEAKKCYYFMLRKHHPEDTT